MVRPGNVDIPSTGKCHFSAVQPLVGLSNLNQEPDLSFEHDYRDGHKRGENLNPDGYTDMTGSGDRSRSPSLEKNNTKRFRLTYDQTRFLVNELSREAYPDAAHRERLSREVPGLTPRQVQIWFQNRRAKLKRMTTNHREGMLKSWVLPDDFYSTKVLCTPFDNTSTAVTPVASQRGYAAQNPDFEAFKTPRTKYISPTNKQEYLASPLDSGSSATERNDGLPHSSMMFHPASPVSLAHFHNPTRDYYPVTKASSLSATSICLCGCTHQMRHRFARSQGNQPGLPCLGWTMDYALPGCRSMPASYDQHRLFGDLVFVADSQGAHMPYDRSNFGPSFYQANPTRSTPNQGQQDDLDRPAAAESSCRNMCLEPCLRTTYLKIGPHDR